MKKLYLFGVLIALSAGIVFGQENSLKPSGTAETYIGDVYPNPFTDQVKISVDTKFDNLVQVEMFDILGNKIDDQLFPVSSTDNSLTFTPQSDKAISKGAYLLRIKVGDKVYTHRLLKR